MATALNSGGSFNIESFVKAASSVAAGNDIDSLSTALESGLSIDSAVSAVESGYTVEQLKHLVLTVQFMILQQMFPLPTQSTPLLILNPNLTVLITCK